jgi:hypothetical protein
MVLLILGWCSRYGLMRPYYIDFKSLEKNYDHIWNTTLEVSIPYPLAYARGKGFR